MAKVSGHAVLAPSAAHRWLHCTPSARLEESMPETATEFSKEGTLAHDLASDALLFLYHHGMTYYPDLEEFKVMLQADIVNDMPVSENLAKALAGRISPEGFDMGSILRDVYTTYVDAVYTTLLAWRETYGPETKLLVEASLKLDEFIPEGFGSVDAAVVAPGVLQIYDLKYGRGVRVNAEDNEQLMCYALGVICGPAETYDVKRITLSIVQPRLNHYSVWTIKTSGLMIWANDILKPTAEVAYKGKGLVYAGDHCRFCKVRGRCRVYAMHVLSISKGESIMDENEIAKVLPLLAQVTAWVKSVEDTALQLALDGKSIPGYKVVEGRSVRKIIRQIEAIDRLKRLGLEDSAYMTEPQLKGITELERSLGRKPFNQMLGDLVERPAGKPTLAPVDDPRPASLAKSSGDYQHLLGDA